MNNRIIWVIFLKILINTIQIKKGKILIVFDEMIAGMLSDKSLIQQ